MANGSSADGDGPITLVPESSPNVGMQISQSSVANVTMTLDNGNNFNLVQLWVNYLGNGGTGVVISITGSLQGTPVCTYDQTFNNIDGATQPPVLVATPDCVAVDQIQITDHSSQDFSLDDISVVLN